MEPRLKSGDGNFRMNIVRRCNENSVDQTARKHLMIVRKARNIRKVLSRPGKLFRRNITDCTKNKIFYITRKNTFGMSAAHVADSDYTDSYCIKHKYTLSLSKFVLSCKPLCQTPRPHLRKWFDAAAAPFADRINRRNQTNAAQL